MVDRQKYVENIISCKIRNAKIKIHSRYKTIQARDIVGHFASVGGD